MIYLMNLRVPETPSLYENKEKEICNEKCYGQ